MKFPNQDRYGDVILSEAKNLACHTQILRFAQNDSADFDWECSLSRSQLQKAFLGRVTNQISIT